MDKMELKFRDIKNLDYPDEMPFKFVLVDMLYKKLIDVNYVLACYTEALDKERHLHKMKFNEACINLTQILGGHFKKGKDKEKMLKRAVHTFNLTDTLPKHIYDSQYKYTKEDEKEYDELCKTLYGIDLKE